MKVKVTLHLEGAPADAGKEGVEGVILEFYAPRCRLTQREVADKFRAAADGLRAELQTSAQ
jgi:hypothetical protein